MTDNNNTSTKPGLISSFYKLSGSFSKKDGHNKIDANFADREAKVKTDERIAQEARQATIEFDKKLASLQKTYEDQYNKQVDENQKALKAADIESKNNVKQKGSAALQNLADNNEKAKKDLENQKLNEDASARALEAKAKSSRETFNIDIKIAKNQYDQNMQKQYEEGKKEIIEYFSVLPNTAIDYVKTGYSNYAQPYLPEFVENELTKAGNFVGNLVTTYPIMTTVVASVLAYKYYSLSKQVGINTANIKTAIGGLSNQANMNTVTINKLGAITTAIDVVQKNTAAIGELSEQVVSLATKTAGLEINVDALVGKIAATVALPAAKEGEFLEPMVGMLAEISDNLFD